MNFIVFNLLSSVLNLLFNFTNDWGIAIAGVTILVKVLLLPLSIKQKMAISKQQEFAAKVNEIKTKYKDNEVKMNEELNNFYTQNSSSMLGCLISLIQIPILIILFKVIRTASIDTGSILVPWVTNLKAHDTNYIISLIYTLISLSPNLLSYIEYLRGFDESKPLKQNIISVVIMSIILTFRSPVALGIYFITSSLVSFIEELIYRLIIRNRISEQI